MFGQWVYLCHSVKVEHRVDGQKPGVENCAMPFNKVRRNCLPRKTAFGITWAWTLTTGQLCEIVNDLSHCVYITNCYDWVRSPLNAP